MTTKNLWIICFVLVIGFIGFLGFFSRQDDDNRPQKVAGINSAVEPVTETAVRPPKMNSQASSPNILAKSSILVDTDSGYRLYDKNSEEKLPIASTTKIMTAIVVLENHGDDLNKIVTITYPMIAVEGSDIQLRVGEKITVENLLRGLLIMSGNDTAYALATYFGGQEKFVGEMNDKAKYLGLKNTHYKDPSGLDDEGTSTAGDLVTAGVYALRLDKFRQIVKMTETTITSADGAYIHDLKTSNHLLKTDDPYYYPSAVGVKTGFTYAAGHCLVSAAEANGHTLLGVVLNTYEDTIYATAKESRKLLEWGFNNWTWG